MGKLRSRWSLGLASGIFLVACYLLYSSLDAASTRRREVFQKETQEVAALEAKVAGLEGDLAQNEQLIGDIRHKIYKLVGGEPPKPLAHIPPKVAKVPPLHAQPTTSQPDTAVRKGEEVGSGEKARISSNVCAASASSRLVSSDVQMLDAYKTLGFENPDGGVWKQGWDIRYDEAKVTQSDPRLEVVVVPHSHCDPGWIKTFEKYYEDQVKNILTLALKELSSGKEISFIYAEVSFFEMWWRGLRSEDRGRVKRLLDLGKLEIVTGGWVMTDEANSHFYATIDQLMEGHQWLEQQLSYRPRRHWSIDPFGLSSTIPALLNAANFSSMVIQRTHYRVKNMLAKKKQLEFRWRPLWAGSSASSDILTHMFPFYSYDVPHTCGPDPKICCQFDFRRLPGMGMGCPWNVPPQKISEANVAERARVLLDQYRKKAELFKGRVLLVPLGDDFRYDSQAEWDAQYDNYKRLFDHINAQTSWNAHVRFGTLSDYFKELEKRTGSGGGKLGELPSLSGDFFTYADRDDHYWSGYYTSRPFYKRMDRQLQWLLRGAETAFALASAKARQTHADAFPAQQLYTGLVEARRAMGLFQHHDGVTGTAKDAVVVDYGRKMLAALEAAKEVLAASTQLLLAPNPGEASSELVLELAYRQATHDAVPDSAVLALPSDGSPAYLVVYNSLAQKRSELVCVQVDSSEVAVEEAEVKAVPAQLSPQLYRSGDVFEISASVYSLCFRASAGPLGWRRYSVRRSSTPASTTKARLLASYNLQARDFSAAPLPDNLSIGRLSFSSDGLLRSVGERKASLSFHTYGTVSAKDKSGAYLFLPSGQARPLSGSASAVLAVSGPLLSSLHSIRPFVRHSLSLDHTSGAIQIANLVDVREASNKELAMRLETDVANGDGTFYTDLNGFQIIKRRYWDKIPLQGNFYPMPTAAFVEDATKRATLLSAQPLGVASLAPGTLDVILDRRLMQDDNRGLFQGVTDNKVTPDTFRLLLEDLSGAPPPEESKLGQLSLAAHLDSASLNHPLFAIFEKKEGALRSVKTWVDGLSSSLPCDLSLVNLRQLGKAAVYSGGVGTESPSSSAALILHRLPVDCRAPVPTAHCEATGEAVGLSGLFKGLSVASAERRSLTLMDGMKDEDLEAHASIRLQPMEIATYKLSLT